MKKNRIAVLATFFWPVSGDVEDYPYNIARMLKESKQNFQVLTPDVWPDGRTIARPKEDSFRGIPIRRFKSWMSITWFTKLWLPRFDKDTSIIHVCGGYRHPHIFIAFLRKGKAKFLISPFFPVHPRKNPLIRLLAWIEDSIFGRYIIKRADCCFAETGQEAAWLKKLGAKKIVILPNSLPEEAFKKGNASKFRKRHNIKGKMLFSLGRQVPIKNFEEIISIIPKIQNTVLVIGGGETGYTKKCKELAERLGVGSRVIFAGFMDSQQKRDAYAACDAYVCSSTRESLGTTVLEAMAQCKPVIATSTGGLPEIIPEKFCLYNLGNKKELAEKIQKIFLDNKFSKGLGRKGREKAEKFRFAKMKKRYLKTLSELSRGENK